MHFLVLKVTDGNLPSLTRLTASGLETKRRSVVPHGGFQTHSWWHWLWDILKESPLPFKAIDMEPKGGHSSPPAPSCYFNKSPIDPPHSTLYLPDSKKPKKTQCVFLFAHWGIPPVRISCTRSYLELRLHDPHDPHDPQRLRPAGAHFMNQDIQKKKVNALIFWYETRYCLIFWIS